MDKKNQIIAIMIETGTIIPIKVLPNVKSSLPIMSVNYYSDADLALLNQFQFNDERTNIIKKFNFENESYERLRFEFSKLINNENKYKKDLLTITKSNESLNNKRKNIKDFLVKVLKDKIVLGKPTDLNIPNIRKACFSKKDNKEDVFCIQDKGIYKLLLSKNNLINNLDNFDYYLGRLTEEILINKSKLNSILKDLIPDVIDKKVIKFQNKNYILFNENDPLILINKINTIFDKTNIVINPHDLLPTKETKLVKFNPKNFIKKHSYLNISNTINLNTKWSKLLSLDYNVIIFNYEDLFENIFKNINKSDFMNEIENYSKKMKLNILLLFNKKFNNIDFNLFGPQYFVSNKYILLYIFDFSFNKIGLIHKGKNYIFEFDSLPVKMKKFIEEITIDLELNNNNFKGNIKNLK